MATKRKLQIRYGAAADRPTLATGELGLDTDTGGEYLHIGTPAGNKRVGQLLGVKRYRAFLTQTGTGNPTVAVIENTLGGTPAVTRANIGTYSITLSGAFTENKTAFPQNGVYIDGGDNFKFANCARSSDNVCSIQTFALTDATINVEAEFSLYYFEIIVYP